jgi:hypothetical protein
VQGGAGLWRLVWVGRRQEVRRGWVAVVRVAEGVGEGVVQAMTSCMNNKHE